MRNMKCLWILIGLVAISSGCGSGPRLYDIPGTITIDGTIPDGATVMFHPTDIKLGYVAIANIGPEEKYKVTCETKPGIPAGSYKVTVTWPDPAKKPSFANMNSGTMEDAPDLLKGAYASKHNTPLTMEVTSSMKEIPPITITTK